MSNLGEDYDIVIMNHAGYVYSHDGRNFLFKYDEDTDNSEGITLERDDNEFFINKIDDLNSKNRYKMEQVNENEFEFRNGDSGVKYLMRGPSIDWGVILLKPGELMADKAHGHAEIDETFYFIEGKGQMIVNGKNIDAPQGSVFLIEPLHSF